MSQRVKKIAELNFFSTKFTQISMTLLQKADPGEHFRHFTVDSIARLVDDSQKNIQIAPECCLS